MTVTDIPPVTFNNKVRPLDARLEMNRLAPVQCSNPFEALSTPAPPTRTLGARAVHEEATAALRPLLTDVRTAEDLSELLESLQEIR